MKTEGRRQKAEGRSGAVSVFLLLSSVFVFGPVDAGAEIVVFKTGRAMSAQSCRIDGDRATVVLRAGGEMVFAAALIDRVEGDEVPWGVADVPPAPPPPGSRVPSSDADLAAKPYANLIAATATAYGVDARLVHAMVEVESNYETRARSPKGAKGLMQLMPTTARQYAVRDPFDPKANLEAGVRHLKDLMGRFDLSTALAAYNSGEGTVLRYGGAPPFPETQSYVRRILQKVSQ